MEPDNFAGIVKEIETEIGRAMVGQHDIIRHTLIGLLAGGNILLEGVPGLGKTRLVKSISQVLSLDFKRIQFTPDLMPADIIGTNIIAEASDGSKAFRFQAGPIFANIILADEINRATPKTQSALLEAMQEKTVSSGTVTRSLPQPFFVLATQNPVEMEGTYPLPEAQMDRFLFKLLVPFPGEDELSGIISMTAGVETELRKLLNAEEILAMSQMSREVLVSKQINQAVARLILATHPGSEYATDGIKKFVRYGASPRGAQAIIATGRVKSLMESRYNVAFEDIEELAYPALRHRILLNFEGEAEGVQADQLIAEILQVIKKELM